MDFGGGFPGSKIASYNPYAAVDDSDVSAYTDMIADNPNILSQLDPSKVAQIMNVIASAENPKRDGDTKTTAKGTIENQSDNEPLPSHLSTQISILNPKELFQTKINDAFHPWHLICGGVWECDYTQRGIERSAYCVCCYFVPIESITDLIGTQICSVLSNADIAHRYTIENETQFAVWIPMTQLSKILKFVQISELDSKFAQFQMLSNLDTVTQLQTISSMIPITEQNKIIAKLVDSLTTQFSNKGVLVDVNVERRTDEEYQLKFLTMCEGEETYQNGLDMIDLANVPFVSVSEP